MIQLDDRSWIAGTRDAAAAISFHDEINTQNETGKISTIRGAEIITWGEENTLPEEREITIRENNIVGQLLKKRINMTLGNGLQAYRPRYEETKEGIRERKDYIETPSEMQDFFEAIDIESYLAKQARNLILHGGIFTEYVMNKGARLGEGARKVNMIAAKESRHMRSGLQNEKGVVEHYYWSGHWSRKKRDKKANLEVIKIPAYRKGNEVGKFIRYSGDPTLFDDYYYHPTWWGSKRWISLANAIPEFHINNLENGYNIRWHIEVPDDYFSDQTNDDLVPEQEEERKEAKQYAKQKFTEDINAWLTGLKNVGRSIFTTYHIARELGKDFPGIKITPLKYDMKDEALLKLFEKSNQAVISAQGLHPTLASIETAGKLASGSEIRNAFLMFLAIDTPMPRRLLLKDIEMVGKLNGWAKDVKLCFKDIELTRLDDEPSGNRETSMQ